MKTQSSARAPRPLVGVPACTGLVGQHPFHMVGDKYIQAVRSGADAAAVLLPALGEECLEMLEHLDGILLTGSYSNIDPSHYGAAWQQDSMQTDPLRDATTLGLIRAAVTQRIPVLGICRGFQEINVALGGSLHQAVHAVAGLQDHRENKDEPLQQQYARRHPVTLQQGGQLAQLMNNALTQQVNSLHGQGVERLAPGLRVEALAPDGLIEAFSLADTNAGFLLGVQWHPEWKLAEHPFYQSIFRAFGRACRARSRARRT
ncbi:gamma-glutamyl-gamma-aminobutyrate hydrolase family protein [Marinobacterium rhizophilum]|uniref:Gamma-glutamyl-gamma-aminobutyrate hydrolase family protein n=1 Tax=Marinobacterium rhizophilum TaxID=420402 RepID=A0ABY5HKY9_9GAMM|nr:gamma-glutamyl-gamma-aminobutyrate hydrolase family protein [Marinobacterium rhizophilum]UTW12968.1 gamma-glutamyl-gamma-aminobutyrate hydrolase family protein [Marinobacterium rhizophilum]